MNELCMCGTDPKQGIKGFENVSTECYTAQAPDWPMGGTQAELSQGAQGSFPLMCSGSQMGMGHQKGFED